MSDSLFVNALPHEQEHLKHIAHCITGIDATLEILAQAVKAETLRSSDPKLTNQALFWLVVGAREQAYLISHSFKQLDENDSW